ncbi:hypothetical protein Sa4125_13970 [Aureimonas sp. SA4125]|uniref:hypothetical protein n=1 Tax=Aureimonas sp. SA4125 TaxID=2826993 RepID=UPI001CC62409|nr:hypothetical protein [Aureimonas sp. SA4125]BDA83855.1 hypothetical protein Sa4125_13970 [Aureimonas sp. SA4125]
MSPGMTDAWLPIAAAIWLLAATGGAAAFSQIGSEDGTPNQKEGIVTVPLPPIAAPAGAADAEATPATGAAPTETTPAGSGQPTPSIVTPPAASPPAAAPTTVLPTTPAPLPGNASPATTPATTPATSGGAPTPPAMDPAEPATDAAAPTTGPAPGAAPGLPEASDADDPATGTQTSGDALPVTPPVPPAEIFYGDADLPKPVRDLRARLIEICKAGEIEALRPYLELGEDGTTVTFGGAAEDPIEFLKSASGDGEGVETLAILLEILQAGHVHNDVGNDAEIFVWPYFTGVPLDQLTKPQQVELFELVTAGDYQEMLSFGAYNFYRAGISPDGKLEFFVAGD